MTRTALLLASTASALLAFPAAAQEQPGQAPAPGVAPATADATGDGDVIIVTGTRRLDRTVADSPVPVDVIGAEALSTSGFTETNRLLNQLVPSFNFPQPSITDGTDVIRPATLRGLGPDQTLVLINGKRRHTTALLNINGSVGRGTAAVDINLIPQAAIERVEVLRDGAAAQYGSDAIAGVINFQLRKAREGGSVSVTYGEYNTRVQGVREVTGIARDAAGNPLLLPNSTPTATFFQLSDTGKERKATDGQTITVTGNIGLPIGAEGYVNLTAEYRDRDATNRTAADPRRYYGLAGTPIDPREFTLNRFTHRFGDAKTEDVLVFVNAGMPLANGFELYAFGSFGDRNGESAAFYRLPNETRTSTVTYPDGFLPLITTRLRDYALTGGIRGEVADVNLDFSVGYARNEFDFLIANTANASLGPNSPRDLDSGGLRYDQLLVNLDASHELNQSLFQSVTLAGGLEYRREGFRLRPGELDSYRNGGALTGQINPTFPLGTTAGNAGAAIGAQGFPGIQPTIAGQNVAQRRERDNFSAYLEADIDLADWWNVQLAGRYERYSDFGDTLNGKAATSIDLIEGLKVRASLSTGFRAPSLQQQYFAATATNNVNGVLLETVTLPVDSPVALALGSRPLRPEKSVSYSAGLVIAPVSSFNFTIDYYNIQIDDRVVVTENLGATRDAAGDPTGSDPGRSIAQILNNAGFNSVNAARFFINGIDTNTKGFDAVASYRTDLGEAALRLTAGFNFNKTTINGRRALPGALGQVPGIVLFGRQESLRLERGQPQTKLNLGADFDWRMFGATVRANRFGSVLGAGGDPFLDLQMTPKWITDLEARVEPIEGLQLAVGANNLFDVYPDNVPAGRGVDPVTGLPRNYGATAFVTPFSSFSPFGFNGRFLYARASYRF